MMYNRDGINPGAQDCFRTFSQSWTLSSRETPNNPYLDDFKNIIETLDSMAKIKSNCKYSFDKEKHIFCESAGGYSKSWRLFKWTAEATSRMWYGDSYEETARAIKETAKNLNTQLTSRTNSFLSNNFCKANMQSFEQAISILMEKHQSAVEGLENLKKTYEQDADNAKGQLITSTVMGFKDTVHSVIMGNLHSIQKKLKELEEEGQAAFIEKYQEIQVSNREVEEENRKISLQFHQMELGLIKQKNEYLKNQCDMQDDKLSKKQLLDKETDQETGLLLSETGKIMHLRRKYQGQWDRQLERIKLSHPEVQSYYMSRSYLKKKKVGGYRPIQFFSPDEVYVHLKLKNNLEPIGEGRFKNVTKSWNLGNSDIVAHARSKIKTAYDLERAKREVRIYKELGECDHIVKIYRTYYLQKGEKFTYPVENWDNKLSDQLNQGILMRYYNKGNLWPSLRDKTLDREQKFQIACDLLEGLSHLHRKKIIHRDLKPENILLDSRMKRAEKSGLCASITDFGCALRLSEVQNKEASHLHLGGTVLYDAPEILLERKRRTRNEEIQWSNVSCASDMWSCGVIFYQLFLNQFPYWFNCLFRINGRVEQLTFEEIKEIQTHVRFMQPEDEDSIERLIWDMLHPDPEKRITPAVALTTLMFIRSHGEV